MLICVYVSVWVFVHVLGDAHKAWKWALDPSKLQLKVFCELPNMGAGNQIPVLVIEERFFILSGIFFTTTFCLNFFSGYLIK